MPVRQFVTVFRFLEDPELEGWMSCGQENVGNQTQSDGDSFRHIFFGQFLLPHTHLCRLQLIHFSETSDSYKTCFIPL